MKIAIPSMGEKMESKIDSRFGRAPYFFIGESKDDLKAVANKAIAANRGAGVSAAQVIVDEGVGAVIGVNFGPRAFWVLNEAKVELYQVGPELTIAQALEEFLSGKLEKLANPTGPGWQGKTNE